MRIIAATAALVLVPVPAVATPVITNQGIGSLKVGMPVSAAVDAGWVKASAIGCNSGWEMARYPKSVYAAVWDDTVKVVSTKSARFSTRRGIRPGDPRRKLLRKYPAATVVSRNIYDDSPVYAVPGRNLHFIVTGGRIVMIEVVEDLLPNGTEFEC